MTDKKIVAAYLIEAEDFHCQYCKVLKEMCKDYLDRFSPLSKDDRDDFITTHTIGIVPTVVLIHKDGTKNIWTNPSPAKVLEVLKEL